MAKKRVTVDPNLFARTDRQDVTTSQGQEGELSGQPNVKTTLYLPPAIMARLELAQVTLRGMAGIKRGDVTMSGVIAAALDIALGDLEQNGAASRLAALLSGKHDATIA